MIFKRNSTCGKYNLHKRHAHLSGFLSLMFDLKMFYKSFFFCGTRSHIS